MSEELRTLVRQAVHEPGGGVPVDDIVRRAQARRTRRHALMGLAPALVLAAALVALPNVGVEQVDLAPISPTAREDPAPVTVTLDRTVVPQGVEIIATVRNDTDEPLQYEYPYELERMTDDGWEEQTTRSSPGMSLDFFGDLASGAEVTDQIVTWHLDPGRYRYRKPVRTVAGEPLAAVAEFDVVPGDPGRGDPEALFGRTFAGTEVTRDGAPHALVPGTEIRLVLSDGLGFRLNAGCNNRTGTLRLGPDRLSLVAFLETSMGCPGRQGQERWVFAFFDSSPAWQLDGSTLRLEADGTVIVLQEVAQPAPEAEGEPAPEPQPFPWPEEPEPPAQDPAALWGRSFVSVSVTEAGQPRQLLPGTRLTVEFEHRDPAGVVRWHSGCNFQGAEVTITPERIHTRDITTTDIGCPPEQHEQDAWSADFFRGHPFWSLDGSRLMLVAGRTVIAFEETD